MISVRSHQLRLSGSRLFLFLLLSIVVAACSTSEQLPRRTTRTATPKKPKMTEVKVKPKVDTVEWTEVDRDTKPPITEFEELGIEKKSSYDISVLFPFDAARLQSAPLADSDDRFINYYGGMMMAIDILNNQGKKLNIDIHDVGDRNTRLKGKVGKWVNDDTDIIIAPFHKKHVEAVAAYGKDKKIPVVSPWLVSSTIAEDNPYYIKLMPDIRDYYYSIMSDIHKEFDADQVVILGESNDKSKIKYLQELAMTMYRTGEEQAVEEFIVDPDSLANGEQAFDDIFNREKPLVVVIPNFSSADESFVYGCVRRLSVEKGEQTVYAYGMPIILNSDRMEFDYFNSLNMRVARSKFVDEYNDRVNIFKADYLSRFGSIPTDDAYEGYDMMMFVGESVWKYGQNFQYHVDQKSEAYLQSTFDIQKMHPKSSTGDDRFDKIDYFVNKHVDIIQFKDFKFTR